MVNPSTMSSQQNYEKGYSDASILTTLFRPCHSVLTAIARDINKLKNVLRTASAMWNISGYFTFKNLSLSEKVFHRWLIRYKFLEVVMQLVSRTTSYRQKFHALNMFLSENYFLCPMTTNWLGLLFFSVTERETQRST